MLKKTISALVLFCVVGLVGCKGETPSFIKTATVDVADDLKTVTVSLIFSDAVQAGFGGEYAFKNYGSVFAKEYSTSTPFEIGFTLNADIVYDQEYVSITPTEHLPNGMEIGVGYPLVELRGPQPISDKFDFFGYVDVSHGAWLGIATMFNFMNNQYFPEGLKISKVFLRDGEGNPGLIASVFGPSHESDGTLWRTGGISLFANVKQLIEQHQQNGRNKMILHPEAQMILSGENAHQYQGRRGMKKLKHVEQNLIRALNSIK